MKMKNGIIHIIEIMINLIALTMDTFCNIY